MPHLCPANAGIGWNSSCTTRAVFEWPSHYLQVRQVVGRTFMRSSDRADLNKVSERSKWAYSWSWHAYQCEIVWTNTMSESASIHFTMSSLTGLHTGQLCTGSCLNYFCKTQKRWNRSEEGLGVFDWQQSFPICWLIQPCEPVIWRCFLSQWPRNVWSCWRNRISHSSEMGQKQGHWSLWEKRDQIKTLADLSTTCSVGKDSFSVDVCKLFHRLLIIAERSLLTSGDSSGLN